MDIDISIEEKNNKIFYALKLLFFFNIKKLNYFYRINELKIKYIILK